MDGGQTDTRKCVNIISFNVAVYSTSICSDIAMYSGFTIISYTFCQISYHYSGTLNTHQVISVCKMNVIYSDLQ